MKVLLSIKPQFADKIFSGEKKFEYRRAIFKNKDIQKIIVYSSSPVKKIIGEFEVEEIIEDKPSIIWERTNKFSGIKKTFFFEYFNNRNIGFAIKIKEPSRYDNPIDPFSLIAGFTPPQSFMYVSDEV